MGNADQGHFGGLARRIGVARFLQRLQQHLPDLAESADRQALGKFQAALGLHRRQRRVLGRIGHEAQRRDEMGEIGKVGEDHGRIGADDILVAQLLQRRGSVALHQIFEQIDDADPVGEAQHVAHRLRGHRARPVGDRLVGQGQGVAHRALGGAGDQPQRVLVDLDMFGRRDLRQMRHQRRRFDAPQVEALAA